MYLKNGGRNCVYNACLYSVIDIEPNGDMFPCSRYYKQDHIIGNISKIKKIAAAFESDNFKKIVIDSIKRRNKCKNDCELYEYCLGGCTSACANETNIADNNTQLCRITQKILHAVFNEIEQAIKENNYVNPVFRYLLQ